MTPKITRHIFGMLLIIVALALLVYDFFSPPVGQLSNFALILFAKLIAIAGGIMNIDITSIQTLPDDTPGDTAHRPGRQSQGAADLTDKDDTTPDSP